MQRRDIDSVFAVLNEVGIINQLSRTMMEARMPPGFLISHFSVLNHLIRVGDGRTPLQIAQAFQVPKTTMTHTLTKLDDTGLVDIRPNPDDGRSKQVWITEAGRAFRDDCIAGLGPDISVTLQKIDASDFAAALPFLARLRSVLDQMRD